MANLFSAAMKFNLFNPLDDKIALVLKEFKLLKGSDGPIQRYSEPYVLSLAIDEFGAANPAIDFNILPFPRVRKGDTVDFGGHGQLLYGPSNPGEFLAYTILFMESDQDIRDLGTKIEGVLQSEVASMGVKALLTSNPTFATAANILGKLTGLIAAKMQDNKDDELFRRNGTLLRDLDPPFGINETFEGGNDFIASKVSVLPLSMASRIDSVSKKMVL